MKNRNLTTGLTLLVLLLVPVAAMAQERCPDGQEARGWIGVYTFHCPGGSCLYDKVVREGVEAMYEFSSEPRMRAIDSGGPAAGILEEGDVLVAVNGFLITSGRGGRELANLPIGEAARLTLRRGDRLEDVTITTSGRCEQPMVIVGNTRLVVPEAPVWSTEPALPPGSYAVIEAPPAPVDAVYSLAPTAPSAGRGVAAVAAPPAPAAFGVSAGPGSLGMAFSCDGCSFTFGEEDFFAWNNPQYLEVEAVSEDGAAAAAGLRPGDLLTHVNGHSLTSDDGGRLIFRARAGERLEIRYERDGETAETVLVVGGEPARIGGVSLYSEDSNWGSALGRLAGALGIGAAPPAPDAPALANGSSLMVSGETWGPSALGAVFHWCDECAWIVQNGVTRWEMSDYPRVAEVTPEGAADVAGLRPGDVLTHVDGLDMKTDEAAMLFLNARDGDRLQVRYLRDGRELSTVLVAIVEPSPRR